MIKNVDKAMEAAILGRSFSDGTISVENFDEVSLIKVKGSTVAEYHRSNNSLQTTPLGDIYIDAYRKLR